ncbi:Coiled-coil domain-containing protein 162 [Collichthys lucidus]|uniref:Coiled-coil domain-containing protein 162 n=1 Tax=Collichthys lucidus TaxID=240159 RepID=A0A4U5VFW7_COLLU|nr:Coiled-coil domain-containing protein 162 [Collichthys lucidus]
MCPVYRVSSSVRVEQMEAELSRQLSALRVEIEENGAVTSKRYRFDYSVSLCQITSTYITQPSVPPPKDISFFRTEREHTLRRGLQVAEALPVQSPADVMQRELDSCLSLEYTPDSLPPLLHQFYTDRSYHLAQIKYLLMLRWRRFCRHASVIEKLYPHYKVSTHQDQVSNLTSEYEDAVQRARRLSASRERILSGRGNPANLLAQDDVVIYLRWLVCHLHSVQHVHNFLTVLHYMPACERKEKEPQAKDSVDGEKSRFLIFLAYEWKCLVDDDAGGKISQIISPLAANSRSKCDNEPAGISGPAHSVPLHTAHLEEFLPELQDLIAHFHLSYDARRLRSSADEMELFSVVKPRRDPWQQKLVTKLKEKKRVDELLKMHSSFLQVSDLHDVAAALKEHSAASASRGGEARRREASEIWTSIYSAASPARARVIQETRCGGRGDHDKSLRSQSTTGESYSFVDSLQLLGLDDSLEEGSSDAMVTRGAYLSLMHLRHLKLRQLQRVSLGLLNYLRSVERSLTFDLAGLQLEDRELCSTAEETGWMNAARGGRGEAGGLGSMQYSHNTPVDCKVRCSEFMEFAEVENLHDFYSSEGRFVHTQDQRGFYIVYDAALKDLEELENELLLVGSHFIQRNRMKKSGRGTGVTAGVHSGSDFDRVALLLDLWTCETEFLESKVQLLNCYYEAYQHAAGTEERCALARVITDIMHSRPQLDLNQDYFVQVYRAEIGCLRSHQQLIKNILDNQIEKQRQYLQRIWRDERKNSVDDYGLPPNYVPKHLVSLGGSRRAHSELCQLHRATSITDKLALRQQLLQQALQSWSDLAPPGVSYSAQIQKDLFSDFFFEDPMLVQKVGLRFVSSAEERDVTQGRERQSYAVETFSRLLELVTIRHRLLGSASETAHLAQLYRHVASELGFDDFHLHLRPVQFEVAEQKDKAEPRPVFITATLEDDSCVDRFTPSHLPLSIQELDENQTGRFSFSSEEAVIHLMNKQSVENLQVTLACQVTQKNALMSALKLVCLCRRAESVMSSAEIEAAYHSDKEVSKPGRDTNSLQEKSDSSPSARTPTTTKERLMEAFVSIQLEKVGLRDEMLNSFRKKKQAAGGLIKTPEEAAEIKRRLIMDFLKQFSTQISQYGVRAQIVAYYYSLNFLLDDIPSIRRSHFTTSDLCPDLRMLQRRQLLSADGKTLLNLWFLPPFSQVLHVFKTLDVSECAAALRRTLQIVSALHDIVYYLVSFSRLGNAEDSDAPGSLAADWGGTEGIGAELLEIQHQVERLSDPSCPESVGRLLQLRRQILLLQFDTAVRHLIREVLLSSGDVASYQSVTDNMASALPLLSDSIQADVFSATLPVPRPLQARGRQLCLSGLSDRRRLQANAAILGVSLLMEDVLNSGREAEPVRLHGDKVDLLRDGNPDEGDELCLEAEAGKTDAPIRVQLVLKGFLLMMKQLQVFKESWARTHLGVQTFRTAGSYQQFVKLYRAEIFYPSMRALAEQTRKERDYEVLISGSQALLPPPGASEVDVKAWQLHKLLESAECDMIRAVQRRISGEMTLLRVSQDRLQLCLTHLGCSLTERERRSFLLYSQFYEQILQQETQLLCQREQDLKNLKDSQTGNSHKEAAAVCRGMMLEISALKAQVAHLEQEKSFLEERLSLKFKERYDPLVRHLVSTCIQLKARLDEHSRQMEQDVSEMVNRTRGEGVDRIIKLKKKYGCTKDNDGLTLTWLKKEEVHELQQENSRLTALLCKLRAVSSWRRLVDQEKLHRQLLQTQQREISCRAEALRVKMMSEEEVVLLQEELDVVRKVLTRCQAECSSTKKLLSRKTEELQVSRHQSAQEACSRQELDSYRVQSLEQMRADVQDRERQLRALSEQLDRGSRVNQLHRQRSAKEIRQVKGKLQQALSLKQEAFQRVDELQDQVNDMEAAFSRCTSMTGPHRTGQQQQLQLGSLSNYNTLQDSATQSRHQRAETARSRPDTRIDRPKAVSEPERHSEVNLNKNTNLRVLQ